MPTIQKWRSEKGVRQAQIEGLAGDDIWAVRTHEDGIQLHRPASEGTIVSPELALDFALSIIEVVKTQCNLYGWPVG